MAKSDRKQKAARDGGQQRSGPQDGFPVKVGRDLYPPPDGFIGGETDQFYPALYRGTTPVDPPRAPEQGYQLTRDLADDCIGWIASCMHGRLPWIMSGLFPFGPNERWELYDIARDFSQSEDLAAKHPEKLRELQDLFMAEAGKYNVLPLDDRGAERMDVTLRPSFFCGRRKVALPGDMVRLPEGSAPKTCNMTHTLTVSAEIPKGGADGVLVCIGGDSGGWTLFVRDGRLVYHYNWFDIERYEVTSTERLPAGEVELSLDFRNESDKPGGPASVRLFVDGKPCGDLKLPKQVPGRFSVESLDVGVDKMSPVCKGYPRKQGFAFTGKIHGVTFEFEGPGAEPSLEERHEQALRME